MKLKYYLRGLGIGMLVAALVLVLSGSTGTKMSDEDVKRRAAQLGMVEKDKTVLEDIEQKAPEGDTGVTGQEPAEEDGSVPEPAEDAAEPVGAAKPDEGTGEPDGTAKPDEGTEESAGEAVSAEAAAAEMGQPEESRTTPKEDADEQVRIDEIEQKADEVADRAGEVAENAVTGRTIILEVRRGDSSISVARRAAEAGLVQSAADFDVFLCQNGYDKRISIGSYEIAEGASEKEIADAITKSR